MLQIVSEKAGIDMYNIKEKTKEMASFVIGISSETFKEFDHDDEMNFLNQADRKGCGFLPNTDSQVIGRGNPLLARDEFLSMDEVNRGLFGE
ncbi:MAG: hypothetical protein HDR17_10010 [Lachnospiraceae bacterium]|nr:hypothetical protein [Lachnospiraceae bacterium]